jgi:choline monooxygenase
MTGGPVTGASTLPADWYVDPSRYAEERRRIFGAEWLFVAPASVLARPGDYVAPTLAGWPLVVVNDAGVLRGFHNVCRHRAGPLVVEPNGSCRSLVCRYHGWAYGLDGELRSARDFGSEEGVEVEEMALWPVAVETWRGLVFAHLDPGASGLAGALGGFAAECAGVAFEELSFTHQVVHEMAANWKVYADNYLEGYHIPLVHPGLNKELDAARYRVEVGDRWCRHTAPTRSGAVNAGLWLWRWPNLALNVYPDGMNVECYWPLGPRRTQVVYSYFFRDGVDDDVVAMSSTVLGEDRAICEAVQRNLEAGRYRTGRLSPRHEQGVAAFQGWVRQALDAPPEP